MPTAAELIADILRAYEIPPHVGGQPPSTHYERGRELVAQAEAFGNLDLVTKDPDATHYLLHRNHTRYGIAPTRQDLGLPALDRVGRGSAREGSA